MGMVGEGLDLGLRGSESYRGWPIKGSQPILVSIYGVPLDRATPCTPKSDN